MKSTKVQNPRRILHIPVSVYHYACTEIGHTPLKHSPSLARAFAHALICVRGVHTPDYTQWCLFSLQHGLAASVGIFRDKAGCYVVDNRWVTSGAALCVEQRR